MIDNNQIIPKLNDILKDLDVEFEDLDNRLIFACPLHASDNRDSLSILLEGNSVNGVWKCWTNGCEKEYGAPLFNLINGIRSEIKPESFFETTKYIEGFTGAANKITSNAYSKLYDVDYVKKVEGEISRWEIRKTLKFPSTYYLDRGFSKDVLHKYDVGICIERGEEMFTRIVVPTYDDDHKKMSGCSGRNQNPVCDKCSKYHIGDCPETALEHKWSNKWLNSRGFQKGNHLYNMWYAKKHIIEAGSVILVEGQPDIWRLEESDIHIGLGMFGTKLSSNQLNILNTLPIYNIIIATDNDKAGKESRDSIRKQCERYYNIIDVISDKKDIGDTPIEEIKTIFDNKF